MGNRVLIRRRRRCPPLAAVGLALATLLLAGCAKLGYYAHSVKGGLELLAKRRSIEAILQDPQTPERLEKRLRLVLEIRAFAEGNLELPLNGAYRSYADLQRPYAVWTVVAAGELAVEPVEWCFLVAGCVTYRGYFSQDRAERFAAKLRGQGYEADVGGVAAFSTLGWFKDPVLNTFVDYPEAELAGLIFHELAHRRIWVKDDTTFNESFATAVELEGARRWLEQQGRADDLAIYREAKRRDAEAVELALEHRERLAAVYAEARSEEWKRERKGEILAGLQEAYRQLKAAWNGDSRWDPWFSDGLNNARLASVGPYHELVPAFQTLLERAGGELEPFYLQVEELARLPEETRRELLHGPSALQDLPTHGPPRDEPP
jgi:predicted aminopeptidase